MFALMKSAWVYRYFIFSSVRNELVNQFARSKLGGLWTVINPLVMVAIYAFILSAVLSAKLPGIESDYAYAIYLTSGFLGWTLFSEVISRCLGLFVQNGNLMKKMVFPKVSLPLIVTGTVTVNNTFLFLAIVGIFAFLGHAPSASLLWLPLVSFVVLVFALGIGLIAAVLNVFIRDISQIIPIFLQFLFWFTPIVYPVSIIPEEYQQWIEMNPAYTFISAYHDVLVYQKAPNLDSLTTLFLWSALLLALGLFMVRKSSAEMVDVL